MLVEQTQKLKRRLRDGFAHSRPRHVLNTLANEFDRKGQRISLLSHPRILQVEVTNRCNLNCLFCSRYYQSLKLGDFPDSLVPAVEEISEKVLETVLFGYGEPLISPAFYTLLQRVRSSRISFITNGLSLTESTLERVLKSARRPIYNIAFSIDGARPETYNRIRERSDFHTVWKNLEHVVKTSRELPNPFEAWVDFVGIRSNIAELPDLVRMAAEAGVSRVNVFHLVVWNDRFREESLLGTPDLNRKYFEAAREAATGTGITLDLPVVLGEQTGGHEKPGDLPRCLQPWSYTYIRYDGTVHVCCHSEAFIMGNLHNQPFREIWNGEKYKRFRRIVNRTLPPDCLKCEMRFRHSPSPDDEQVYLKGKPRDM